MKYVILACKVAVYTSPKIRTASATAVRKELNELTLRPFGNQIVKRGSIKGLVSKLKQIYQAFQKMPDLWVKFKEMLGITATSTIALYKELGSKFEAFLETGKKWIDDTKKHLEDKHEFFKFFFLYASNAPTITSVVKDAINKLAPDALKDLEGFVDRNLKGFKSLKDWIVNFFEKHPMLHLLSTPAKAYLFWVIWVNVTEISWKVTDIIKGFLGMISWGDLLESLPESGLGFLCGLLFPSIPQGWIMQSLKISWNILIIPMVGLQVYWLYKNHYVKQSDIS